MNRPMIHYIFCSLVAGFLAMASENLQAAEVPPAAMPGPAPSSAAQPGGSPSAAFAAALGITFVEGSSSTVILERAGKKFLVDLAARSVAEVSAKSGLPASNLKADPSPAKSQETAAAKAPKKAKPRVYEPGDDSLLSLPTGRRLDRHGFYVNFTHRFALDPAFTGTARGAGLLGLDGFSLSSFGFRYGVTKKFSASIFRSPSFIGRPIQLMGAYNLTDEHDGLPLNSAFRVSVEGQDDFKKNYTVNIEGIFSRSLTSRAQIYFVPTVSFNNHRLPFPNDFRSRSIPNLPGYNTFALGAGGSLDIRPSVALIAEVIPTLSGGRNLEIHRPAYAFGIQKKIWRHAFTFGFTNSPGVTVSQRAGTRAAYLGDPTADTPGGLFIGFDLTRQIN